MPRYEHKQIIKMLNALDELPSDAKELNSWVKAEGHIEFLQSNAQSREMVVYASPEYSFIHSIAVPEDLLSPLDKDDLMKWSLNPYVSAASYAWGGGRDGVWVERESWGTGSQIISKGTQLIYGRTFEGWSGSDRNYYELSQEYAHLEGLHWRPEQKGYCKYDQNGDIVSIVSTTKRSLESSISLVTFDWDSLEYYLAASNQALIRLFDFTLLDRSNFTSWGKGKESLFYDSDEIFFKQKIYGPAAYTRGVQIIRPSCPKNEIFSSREAREFGTDETKHVEFITYDWRNGEVSKISTSSEATTNYFEAEGNNLPYELSPAFFKPEVLLKYKADKDKYTVSERDVRCRSAWYLEAFDVNDAGQVFAYICYLRRLPKSELLHWLSYNEEPKAPISERAYTNDFQGQFVTHIDPLEQIKRITKKWDDENLSWWKLRDEKLIDNVTFPHTASRDEWGDSFLTLTQLVNEGFEIKVIRARLREEGIDFEKQEGSLALLEKLINFSLEPDEELRLRGLRLAQLIRTKTKGHSAKSDAETLALEAIDKYETYSLHFRHVCELICDELSLVQSVLGSNVES